MVVVVCIDLNKGMLFQHRRQSRDRLLVEDVLRECEGRRLCMNTYTYGMFEGAVDTPVMVSENFMELANDQDVCFVEDDKKICGFSEKIRGIILYQWNRNYPADRYFSLDLADGQWELERQDEFCGFSHDRITKEVYRRK